MICSACRKENLPGGVRCSYCGTSFGIAPPPAPEETNGPATPGEASTETAPGSRLRAAGWIGTLALLLFKGKSLLALLNLGKIATTLVTMGAFIWADALLFGWKFGVGLALSILVHEMGHVFVNWRKGLPQSAPVFIPFAGAVIFLKDFPDDPTIQSESGAGGPVAGSLAAIVCLAVAHATRDPFWLSLAQVGFLINLFNLAPFPPLDGSHIATVFSPGIWGAVLVGMLLVALKAPLPMLWLVLVVGFIFRLGHPDVGRHLLAPPRVRVRMAALYLVLCVGLSLGVQHTIHARPAMRAHAGSAADVRFRETTPAAPVASRTHWTPKGQLAAAGAAAAVFAVGYGLYARTRRTRLPRFMVNVRRLGWAAAGALLTAYTLNSALVAGVVLVAFALFCLRYPFMPLFWLASVQDSLGNFNRAHELRSRALQHRLPLELSTEVRFQAARAALRLERGREALEALEGVRAAAPELAETIHFLDLWAASLALVGRVDEALRACERILSAPTTDPLGRNRLLLVHNQLSRLAYVRGWLDEAQAQMERCKEEIHPAAKPVLAIMDSLLADILVSRGNVREARLAAKRALEHPADAVVQAQSALVLARVALAEHDKETALREARKALRVLRGSLAVHFWTGYVERECGDRSSTLLKTLAENHPEEYWGRRAQDQIGTGIAAPAVAVGQFAL